ncbi:M23 family metallopeptidase [Bacillaceae bacterium S4-13-58]
MKRDVKLIRKSIEARRKKKYGLKKHSPSKLPPLVQEEERYGLYPFSPSIEDSKNTSPTPVPFLFKLVLSGILFFSVAILLQLDDRFAGPQKWVEYQLSEEFQFAAVNSWYKDTFGEPLAFLPIYDEQESEENKDNSQILAMPVTGTIGQTFQVNGEGILIQTNEKSFVKAMEEGTVVFAGNREDTGKTVIIQHSDNTKSYYGQLSSILVEQYQGINKNDAVGEVIPQEGKTHSFYFAIEKNKKFIDPLEVMKVDDLP